MVTAKAPNPGVNCFSSSNARGFPPHRSWPSVTVRLASGSPCRKNMAKFPSSGAGSRLWERQNLKRHLVHRLWTKRDDSSNVRDSVLEASLTWRSEPSYQQILMIFETVGTGTDRVEGK